MKAFPWILAAAGLSVAAYLIVNAQTTQYASGDPDVEDAASKTSAWGSKQRVTGTGNQLGGKLKEGKAKQGVGNLTGDDQLAGEGVVDETVGTVTDAPGKAAHAVSDTIHDLNN